ncbi:MAG: hypothetical protein IKJ37_02045 [Kiritimatiellae bacterium]|nr:hypothetical protein [Kiritimatiellia bacterium]
MGFGIIQRRNCEELNKRYGTPGRIVFRDGPQGYPIVALANQYGSAELSLFGAQVLSYRPTGNFPVLFTPSTVEFGAEKADHGGIPICWPWFGVGTDPYGGKWQKRTDMIF